MMKKFLPVLAAVLVGYALAPTLGKVPLVGKIPQF